MLHNLKASLLTSFSPDFFQAQLVFVYIGEIIVWHAYSFYLVLNILFYFIFTEIGGGREST